MHINLEVIVEYCCGGDSNNQNHIEYVSKIHLAGPSKDNDKNCIMLIFEDKSNCIEMKSICKNKKG
jgi:hypothetical protein